MEILTHRLNNGLTVVAEPAKGSVSTAFTIYITGGAAYDKPEELGGSSLMMEMLGKGAGGMSSRELSEAFENLGVSRGRSAGIEACSFSAAMLPDKFEKALELTSKLILEPNFPEPELEPVRQIALQELRSLEDEPSGKVMVELSNLFYPSPFGNPQMGNVETVTNVSIDNLKDLHDRLFRPSNTVIGVAGNFDWENVKATIEKLFGSWSGECKRLSPGEQHIVKDSNQVQLALAYPSIATDQDNYYVAKVANGVLSGGMSGRLFIEVREKRGLVYSVRSSHSGAPGRAAIIAYAGTTPANARECLDVMYGELQGVGTNLTEEELNRAKADLKSRVVMQSEVSSARASTIAHNWWSLERVRGVDEVKQSIDKVGIEDIANYGKKFPASPVALVVIGPEPVELSS